MHLGQPPRTTTRIDPRSRKRLALFVALVLSSGAFVLLSGEARAQQQPTAPHQQQQQPEIAKQQVVPASATPPGVEEYPAAVADKGVAEPVDQAVTVAAPTAVPSLPPKPATEKTSRTSLSGEPKKPATEKPGATKPRAALPEESPARVLVRPELEPEHAPVGPDPAPTTPASVSVPISVPASKHPPETAPEPVAPERSDPLPTSVQEAGPAAARGLGPATLPPEEDFFFSESTPLPGKNTSADDPAAAPTGPVLDPYFSSPPRWTPVGLVVVEEEEEGGGRLARVLSNFETAANAFGSAMEAARSATTSAAADALQTLAYGAPESSSSDGAQASATQEEGDTTQPPSQPTAPLLPPLGEGPLFSSSATGQAGPGSGFVVLLLGVLVSGLVLLLWRDGPLSLVYWKVPKPTSALLSPLERPG